MSEAAWQDATLAAALFAVDRGLGGMSVRALPGPVRDRFLVLARSYMPAGVPWRRVPLNIADDRLLGGLDLAATLQAGRPIALRGLLAEADGGVLLLAMAERLTTATAARLGAALDFDEVVAERDGMALRSHAAIGVVALDEGVADDEKPPAALLDRLAFLIDFSDVGLRDATLPDRDVGHIQAARALLPSVTLSDDIVEALCTAASALGVASMRAVLLAARVARAAAALGGRHIVAEADAMDAARLVFSPRATRLPIAQPEQQPAPQPDEAQQDTQNETDPRPEGEGEDSPKPEGQPLGEILLDAARAAMPAGLLAQLLKGGGKIRTPSAGRSGLPQLSAQRGRPIGVRRGELRAGARLNLIETLRAAAPWQTIRRRSAAASTARVFVTKDDFRITRFRQRTETTTIFLVDASGSAALNRLAEAKGAVELVLADCYVRRDRVALIAFRGTTAELLLAPTASLVRAKRGLAGLPGGGGTPLATGIDAATALADATRRRGQTPILVLLSDGRANIARDGTPGRPRAEEDAVAAGRQLRAAGVTCVLVDTSPRPAPQARRLAGEMGALYLPLPYADAAILSKAVKDSTHG